MIKFLKITGLSLLIQFSSLIFGVFSVREISASIGLANFASVGAIVNLSGILANISGGALAPFFMKVGASKVSEKSVLNAMYILIFRCAISVILINLYFFLFPPYWFINGSLIQNAAFENRYFVALIIFFAGTCTALSTIASNYFNGLGKIRQIAISQIFAISFSSIAAVLLTKMYGLSGFLISVF